MHGEADAGAAIGRRRLEAEPIAHGDGRGHVNEQLAALATHDDADAQSAIVGLIARDVLSARSAAQHSAGKAA